MKQNTSTAPKVVEDCHELLEWIIPKLDQFPRNRRFTLGERIETGLLIVLENLIVATYQKSNISQIGCISCNANRVDCVNKTGLIRPIYDQRDKVSSDRMPPRYEAHQS
ncbi:MAG: hypothetical protein ACRESZ_22545 [Methylococcales bacterium]